MIFIFSFCPVGSSSFSIFGQPLTLPLYSSEHSPAPSPQWLLMNCLTAGKTNPVLSQPLLVAPVSQSPWWPLSSSPTLLPSCSSHSPDCSRAAAMSSRWSLASLQELPVLKLRAEPCWATRTPQHHYSSSNLHLPSKPETLISSCSFPDPSKRQPRVHYLHPNLCDAVTQHPWGWIPSHPPDLWQRY